MSVLAPTGAAVVLACPECGHGSSEPRDREAHLDAHRQLRAFLEEWDAAAAADAGADRRAARRRSVLYGAAILVALPVGWVRSLVPAPSRPVGAPPAAGRPPAAPPCPRRSRRRRCRERRREQARPQRPGPLQRTSRHW